MPSRGEVTFGWFADQHPHEAAAMDWPRFVVHVRQRTGFDGSEEELRLLLDRRAAPGVAAMRQNNYIRKIGPFVVESISQDGYGVRMMVYPAFTKYNLPEKERQKGNVDPQWKSDPRWVIQRLRGNGGGPGIFTAMGTAKELEDFLNQPYGPEEIQAWKNTLSEALAPIRKRDQKRFDRAWAKKAKRMPHA